MLESMNYDWASLENYFLVTGNNALVNGQALKNYFLVIGNNAQVNGQLLEIISC
jgi:hypothetical protein